MTTSERLRRRLIDELGLDIPAGTKFRRTYAGRCQRQAGAWSWYAMGPDYMEICGSHYPMTTLVKAKALCLVTYHQDVPSVDPVRSAF